MTVDFKTDEMILLLKESVPSYILVTLLQHVPAFASAHSRLTEAHAELWDTIDIDYRKAQEFLTPEINIIDLFTTLDRLMKEDEHLQYLFDSYSKGLSDISEIMGSPQGFEMAMIRNDIVNLPAVREFSESAASMALKADYEDVGTWPLHLRQYMEGLMLQVSGVESPTDLLKPGEATKARRQIEKEGRKIVTALTRPDPTTPIACWTMVKVCGLGTTEIAEDLEYQERWGQIQVREGARLLGVQSKRGRPNRSRLPVVLWEEMQFSVNGR